MLSVSRCLHVGIDREGGKTKSRKVLRKYLGVFVTNRYALRLCPCGLFSPTYCPSHCPKKGLTIFCVERIPFPTSLSAPLNWPWDGSCRILTASHQRQDRRLPQSAIMPVSFLAPNLMQNASFLYMSATRDMFTAEPRWMAS